MKSGSMKFRGQQARLKGGRPASRANQGVYVLDFEREPCSLGPVRHRIASLHGIGASSGGEANGFVEGPSRVIRGER
ncbi:hypothetical protein SBA4_3250013 [Candidatus Sulfopaludibacter sp. SbA4]|nr:hypothetical protein SBA4_3250013 [Candidatus Sulfopaludibacter sp. SbA4]